MKRSLLLLFLGVLFMSAQIMAQMTVSGSVTDADGEPLIGVNIVEKGTTKGTVTDLDGNYSISVAQGSILVFSYVGYDIQELPAAATVNVVLLEAGILDEVVVSALSIERNAREVVYANQTVKAEDLVKGSQTGSLAALQGKLAGVKISSSSGTVGASTKVVLRGESSLTGGNNALIVVDGIPIDNSALQGGQGSSTDGFVDYGNRGNEINIDDIESVTVLKGPSATALYGSRGANGVIVYTTKKGAAGKKFSVGLSTTTTFEKAYIQLKRQDQWGQGYGTCFCDPNDFWSGENFSWGPEFDGVMRPWTSPVLIDGEYQFLSRPYSNVDNQLESFFNTGRTSTTSVNFSGGNDRYTYRASYSNTDQQGILDPGRLKRNSFGLSGTAKFSDKLKSEFSANYTNSIIRGISEGNTFSGGIPNGYFYAVQTPTNIPFNELRDYNNPFHSFQGYYGSFTINPYFILNESSLTTNISNLLGNLGLTYTPIEGLNISARVGTNYVTSFTEEKLPVFTYEDHLVWIDNLAQLEYTGRESSLGSYTQSTRNSTSLEAIAQANYTKEFGSNGDYSIGITAGYNFNQVSTDRLTGSTVGGLVIPGFYSLGNSKGGTLATQANTKFRLYGAFGQATFGFRNMLFLEYVARNDWDSRLPVGSNSFFYHSGGVSFIATEVIPKNDILSYMKLRTSMGSSGRAAGVYLTSSVFVPVSTLFDVNDPDHNILAPINGQAVFAQGNQVGNPTLKPELEVTYEGGVDLAFYKNRITAEYTYYNSTAKNLIVNVSVPASSGYTTAVQNVGKVRNSGHELTTSINPLPSSVKDVKINLFANFTKNKSEVIEASPDADEINLGNFGGFGNSGLISLVAKEGLPYGTWKALGVRKDPNGNIIVGPTGIPLNTEDSEYFGNYQPDFTIGFGTDVSWKGLAANILFDVKKGGEFFSYTKSLSEFNGTSSTSALNNREDFIVEGSVQEVDNGDGTFSYVENTTPVHVYDYITNQPGGADLIDASYIKLRELGLSYTLPSKLFENNPLSSVTIGFIARNLKFWLADENTFADPEVNGVGGTGNAVGVESHATPTSRSFGFRVDVKF
jgi:TonB-linked SusC/RagA family outer membrane protein